MTPITVRASEWSQSTQRLKASALAATAINAQLERLRHEANALSLANPEDEALKAALLKRLGRAPSERKPTLLEHFSAFVKFKAGRVKPGTMEVYEALRQHLTSFLGGKRVTGADVGRGFVEDFQTYLIGEGLSNSTANKYASRLKTFLTWLGERGHIKVVPKAAPLKTAASHVVRLTLDELAALQNVDLSEDQPGYAAARDIFLLCVFSGQRIGDIAKMAWKDIQGDAWYLREEKTGVIRRVPLPAPAQEIIQRQVGKKRPVPKLSEQKTNSFIKIVAKRAGINAPVTLRSQKGGKIQTRTVPKHEAMCTHVGRKTFVSLMLEAGLSTKDLLGLTHSDLRSLKAYASPSEDHLRKAMTSVFGDTDTRRAQ